MINGNKVRYVSISLRAAQRMQCEKRPLCHMRSDPVLLSQARVPANKLIWQTFLG